MTEDVQATSAGLVINPRTGEALALAEAPTDELADIIDAIKEREDELRSFKRLVADEILRRMDHERTYTAHLPGGLKLTGDGPRGDEYDGERLHTQLRVLVDEGVIGEIALRKAVETTTAYRVRVGGVRALLKGSDERIVAAVSAAAKQNLKPRGVRVSRDG